MQTMLGQDAWYQPGQSVEAILKMTNKKKVLKGPSNGGNWFLISTTNTVSSGIDESFYKAGVLNIQMYNILNRELKSHIIFLKETKIICDLS
mgnify:CR=1 FL=1